MKYSGNTMEINRALRGGQAKYDGNKPGKPVEIVSNTHSKLFHGA